MSFRPPTVEQICASRDKLQETMTSPNTLVEYVCMVGIPEEVIGKILSQEIDINTISVRL